jgi:hypothetical protein
MKSKEPSDRRIEPVHPTAREDKTNFQGGKFMTIKTLKRAAVAVLLAAVASAGLPGQTPTPPPQTFSTTIYFDYSFFGSNNGDMTNTTANPNLITNKFAFRRAYFTYENKISNDLKFRFRIDADNNGLLTSTSGSKDDRLRPFVKHIYLDWAGLLPNSSLKIGMTETMAFKIAEDRWGLRSVAKTLVDGYKDSTGVDIRTSSADLGVNITGAISKELRYGAMVMNGEGYAHPELNKYKKFGGFLQLVPVSGINIFGYAEYEKLSDKPESGKMYKVDCYIDLIPGMNITGEWFTYNSEQKYNAVKVDDGTGTGNTITVNKHFNAGGYSIFSTYKIVPEVLHVFARYDKYQPDSTNTQKDMSVIITGLDWTPIHSSWKIQPNVWFTNYTDAAKKGDIIVNLTFFLSF